MTSQVCTVMAIASTSYSSGKKASLSLLCPISVEEINTLAEIFYPLIKPSALARATPSTRPAETDRGRTTEARQNKECGRCSAGRNRSFQQPSQIWGDKWLLLGQVMSILLFIDTYLYKEHPSLGWPDSDRSRSISRADRKLLQLRAMGPKTGCQVWRNVPLISFKRLHL